MISPIDFYKKWQNPSLAREVALVNEIIAGNHPSWMFELIQIQIGGHVVEVLPDYLCLGNDQNYVRCPMTPLAAQALADHFGYSLPIPDLVDAIHQQAQTKLAPQPTNWYVHDYLMRLGSNYIVHNAIIQERLHATSREIHTLISGHKKDVVSTPKLKKNPNSVAIYGWHTSNTHVIQPLFLGHANTYEDYSHGIRLVKDESGMFSGRCSEKGLE